MKVFQGLKDSNIAKLVTNSPGYSKSDIIKLSIKYGDLEHDLTTSALQKRLTEILEFLNSERIQTLLEHSAGRNPGNHFYNLEMNLTKATGEKFEEYDYNIIDAIFLASLISLWSVPFIKKVKKPLNDKVSRADEVDWTEKYHKILYNFKDLIDEYDSEESWEVLSTNIGSLFFQFTNLSPIKNLATEASSNLNELVRSFEGLSDEDQVFFYNKLMKGNIEKVLTDIKTHINHIKENSALKYEEYLMRKKLVNIDKQVEICSDYPKSMSGLFSKYRKLNYKKENETKL